MLLLFFWQEKGNIDVAIRYYLIAIEVRPPLQKKLESVIIGFICIIFFHPLEMEKEYMNMKYGAI